MKKDHQEGFFGRWSRLKHTAERPQSEPAPDAQAPPDPVPPPEPEPLSEEDLAALPRIEDLTQGSDITVFLRAGVPRYLRNAALRRMWMVTPAIRNHRDPAVDYAWDWNTPGGVPGDGVGPSPERAAEMLRALVEPREKPALETPARDEPEPGEAVAAVAEETGDVSVPPTKMQAARQEGAAVGDPDTAQVAGERPRRRHGSARPG